MASRFFARPEAWRNLPIFQASPNSLVPGWQLGIGLGLGAIMADALLSGGHGSHDVSDGDAKSAVQGAGQPQHDT